MDIGKALLKDPSRRGANKIIDYVADNQLRFKALIEVFEKGPYRQTQRAAWVLGILAEKQPELFRPYITQWVRILRRKELPIAVKRNILRILIYVDLPKRLIPSIIQIGFNILQNKSEPVAIRVFAMMILERVVAEYPELHQELAYIITEELPYAKPAFRSRGIKILDRLNRLKP